MSDHVYKSVEVVGVRGHLRDGQVSPFQVTIQDRVPARIGGRTK
jgi:flavin-binding protein dodecin